MATEINRIWPKSVAMFYISLLVLGIVLVIGAMLLWDGLTTKSAHITLEIHAVNVGDNAPDGFFILRNLENYNVHFNSIVLKGNILLLTFDSHEQSEQAQRVLFNKLPDGFVIEQHHDIEQHSRWLNKIWHN